ncbi:MAG TPA: hypothetical protein PLO33_05835 [Kouleothrix sp.]|uniref:hypothetical protein n=1 Tax=Kouleothrix sp. TaxID=2779161 RepID=UPI002CDCE69A|nr:hypothetical protein [Kouleothrix sp.]HRC75178.1 hypothetical protein [Kouleothrix sp.]
MFSFALIALCGLVALVVLGLGGFVVLLKLGIIVREAQRPTYQDTGNYTLDQGREVRPEDEQAARERR